MSQLFETIKCVDGILQNMKFHQERFNISLRACFGSDHSFILQEYIQIPDNCKSGLYRCRVTYSDKIENVEFIPHQYRKVESLKLVHDERIDYHFKYADRKYLTQLFNKREHFDDILIVKNKLITDSYTANPIFFDGEKWWTPDSVLLHGTQRARLLLEGKIAECKIVQRDLPNFQKVGLINALQSMENMPVINIKNVYP